MEVRDLGLMAYAECVALQRRWRDELLAGRKGEALLTVEHPPVLTLGRLATPSDSGLSAAQWAEKGVEVHVADRGGRATFHGPGQVIVYPVIDLTRRGRDLRAYVRGLEDAGAAAVRRFGLNARPGRDPVGVFAGAAKIASIGVSVSRWVTQHGIALNVTSDLSVYQFFAPCGLEGVTITRLADLVPATFEEAKAALVEELLRRLDVSPNSN
jgi:lipoate-protein ligase B